MWFYRVYDINATPPNDCGETETPLLHAAARGHLGVIKILMSFTDTPNAPNSAGWTPIYYAAGYGDILVL